MTRKYFVLIHRYVGLAMTLFLILVGLTGSALAFYNELDRWLNPELMTVTSQTTPMLDPLTLRDRAELLEPKAHVDQVPLTRKPDEAFKVTLEPKIDPDTGKNFELPYTEAYLNPYTGEKLGARKWGEVSFARKNLLPFLYRLHYSLALPDSTGSLGGYILGVTALFWTLDCFIGFYLTLPKWKKSSTTNTIKSQSFWQRWQPAWLIKRSRFNYDLHRASGLWLWPMLLVLAWSSVAFNLNGEVYQPVMKVFFEMETPEEKLPARVKPLETPKIGWREAYALGQQLLQDAARRDGFTILAEEWLWLDRNHGTYQYWVRSSLDRGKTGNTRVLFDADTGEIKKVITPDKESRGETITRWLFMLHMAAVFGLPLQMFVCLMGFVITALSVTGVVIWWRKRRAVKFKRNKTNLIVNMPKLNN
jgi:uncharacterized iron-regulated membrane protein